MLEQAIEQLVLEIEKLRRTLERLDSASEIGPARGVVPRPSQLSPTTSDGFMTEQALADLAGMSVASVRKWRRLGTGPQVRKFGRAVRYSRAEVMAWLDEKPTA
jgi:predicted DNA-binding transcriptional regulator AlpA